MMLWEDTKRLKIGAHWMKVVLRDLDGTEMEGMANSTQDVIVINENASWSRKVELLLHEAFHLMLTRVDYSQAREPEEMLIGVLAERMVALMRDNQPLFKEILRLFEEEDHGTE